MVRRPEKFSTIALLGWPDLDREGRGTGVSDLGSRDVRACGQM